MLALGATIGLNTTLFTVSSGIAMRPWAVRDASQGVQLFRAPVGATDGTDAGGFALEEYRYLAQHARTSSGVIAMHDADDIVLGDAQRPAEASYVTGNYFQVLGSIWRRAAASCRTTIASTCRRRSSS